MTERELIRKIRAEVVALPCRCERMSQVRVCDSCYLLGIIDKGLAEIGQKEIKGVY